MITPVTFHQAEKYAVDMHTLQDTTKTFLLKNFGCARKVYNLYVAWLYDTLEKEGYTGGDDIPNVMLPEVTQFKKQFPFLKESDSLALANAKQDFERALKGYREDADHKTYTRRALRRDASGTEPLSFRGLKGMPKFHAKAMGYFSYKTNCQYPAKENKLQKPTIRLENSVLYLPKLKQGVRLICHRDLPESAVIGNVTLSMDACGCLYASIEYSYTVEMEMSLRDAVRNGDTSVVDRLKFLGLDYSQEDFYVDDEGRKANYPHFYKKSEGKLARLQRRLSHMEKDSANYKKLLAKIQKLHRKIANQRRDYLHKLSTELVNTYDVIVVEDIDLRAMGSGLCLGKKLHDNGFGMFRTMLAYKLERKGSVLVKVDRFYPSTKTCSCCGYINPCMDLETREWDCPSCGTHHHRDENAAKNIQAEGRRIFMAYFLAYLEEKYAADKRLTALRTARKNKRSGQKSA